MNEFSSIHDLLTHTLTEMGIAAPTSFTCTCLLQEGHLVAEKFVYDGGYAVWIGGKNVVVFYDENGAILQSVAMATAERKAA